MKGMVSVWKPLYTMLALSFTVQQPASKPSSGVDAMVETYVSFSTAHLLRMNIEPIDAHEDPELDVEAQFSRQAVRGAQAAIVKKKQLQCVSGWLWCKSDTRSPLCLVPSMYTLI